MHIDLKNEISRKNFWRLYVSLTVYAIKAIVSYPVRRVTSAKMLETVTRDP